MRGSHNVISHYLLVSFPGHSILLSHAWGKWVVGDSHPVRSVVLHTADSALTFAECGITQNLADICREL